MASGYRWPSHPGVIVRVLVAEDDPFFLQLLQHLLTPDCEISTADNGDAAWAVLQKKDGPALALLDWVMPGLTGPQICREARANPKTANIYIILLTARNSSDDIVAGLRAGADDYVTKPFQPEELRARVRVGQKVVQLQRMLAAQETALQGAHERELLLQNQLRSLREVTEKQEIAKAASA
jgi:DNA-binding response OmpR family regulator